MKRIHNLLRKIQDVYYQKGDKQLIDMDLMLDYTRVLYADLLEWRKIVADSTVATTALPEEPVTTTSPAEAYITVPDDEQTIYTSESAPEPGSESIPVLTTTEPEEEPAVAAEPVTEETEVAVPEMPDEVIPHVADEVAVLETEEPAQPEAPVAEVETTPDEEALKPVLEHIEEPIQSEIHLELPVVAEEPEAMKEPVIIATVEPQPKPAAEHKSSTEYVFQKSFKDVRSFIGINDKYQFMNELFANNKTAYESTLDKINFCSTLKEAEQWITGEMRNQYNWSEEDETYQSLLTTVKKYFA